MISRSRVDTRSAGILAKLKYLTRGVYKNCYRRRLRSRILVLLKLLQRGGLVCTKNIVLAQTIPSRCKYSSFVRILDLGRLNE
jgi:hypothetical protein